MYFNSQPHKEADFSVMIVFAIILNISTHSLTRRLTNHFLNRRNEMSISTHSLTRRLTITGGEVDDWFNISTHSLTRRLTVMAEIIQFLLVYFNSQPHKEADYAHTTRDIQSWYFNSQPHKEADKPHDICSTDICISTHSLTRRLTQYSDGLAPVSIFQLTASQGGWPGTLSVSGDTGLISTHSLTRRLTRKNFVFVICKRISTHSLTRRLTVGVGWQYSSKGISTHSLTRRLTRPWVV